MRGSRKILALAIWPLRWVWWRLTLGRWDRGYQMGFRYGRSLAHHEAKDGWRWDPEVGWHGPQAPAGLGLELELDTTHFTHVEIGEHPGEIGLA